MESDSDECDNGDDKTVGEDDCEEFGGDTPLLQEGQALLIVDYTRCLSADTNAEMPHNPIRPNVYEEGDDHDQNGPDQHTLQQPATLRWTLPSRPRISVVHNYTRGPRGKDSEAPHINDSSSPLSVFLYFAEIITAGDGD
jgi:hypothetical protein